MAVLSFTGKEGGGIRASIQFVISRYRSYIISPLAPLGIIAAILLCCILFGIVHLIPFIGDLADSFFWWLPLAAGITMALILIGLIGYPLMYCTLSTEGSDTFDALSRSYNYVYEAPARFIWYSLVSIVYGAILTFVVIFIGSTMVYLSKWGVNQTPAIESLDRSTEYLFVYAPSSLGWRELLLSGSPVAIDSEGKPLEPIASKKYFDSFYSYNYFASGMVAFWISLLFLMMLGFGYSYFWTANTMIYLLMRKHIDETDMDEVYVEDFESKEAISPPQVPTGTATTGAGMNTSSTNSQMVESPSLRVATPSTDSASSVSSSSPILPAGSSVIGSAIKKESASAVSSQPISTNPVEPTTPAVPSTPAPTSDSASSNSSTNSSSNGSSSEGKETK